MMHCADPPGTNEKCSVHCDLTAKSHATCLECRIFRNAAMTIVDDYGPIVLFFCGFGLKANESTVFCWDFVISKFLISMEVLEIAPDQSRPAPEQQLTRGLNWPICW